jgi:hypothetical protein
VFGERRSRLELGAMKKDKEVGGGPSSAAISDPRFARVHTDLRFMRMPKNRTKVAIDQQFAHMFSGKSFSDPLGADKRGRAKKKKEKHMLQRYYKVGDGEEDSEGEAGVSEPTDEEPATKSSKSKGKGPGKKLRQKGKSEEFPKLKFPGPLAPSKLGLEESDEQESDEQVDSDEEIRQKAKVKGKAKGKELLRPKLSAPILEESDEEGDSEIDLNSDESEEELEQEVGRKSKNRNALIVQQEGDSEEGEDDGSELDEESSSSSSSSESEPEEETHDSRDEEQVPTAPGAETRRFAMMNMDWEHIKAIDLLMLMRSFQPKGGHVECVTVYPSEFGIEQMKAEEVCFCCWSST